MVLFSFSKKLILILLIFVVSNQLFAQNYFNKCISCKEVQNIDSPIFIDKNAELELDFFEDFKNQKIDTSNWTIYYPYPKPYDRMHPGGNETLTPNNLSFENDTLIIKIKEEKYTYLGQTRDYTSGLLHSKKGNTFKGHEGGSFLYGYYEIKAMMPKGTGFWPALWFFGWAGEVDILEMNCLNLHEFQSNFHKDGLPDAGFTYISESDLSADFHLYAMNWTPYTIKFYFDHQLIRTFYRFYTKQKPRKKLFKKFVGIEDEQISKYKKSSKIYESKLFPNENHYMDLNISLGVGTTNSKGIGGKPDTTTPKEGTMKIDYIKIQQSKYTKS